MSGDIGTYEANSQNEVKSVLDDQSGATHSGIVVVYDVNRRASFEEAQALIKAARNQLVESDCSCVAHLPLVLVANKIDRPKRKRTTLKKEGVDLAAKYHAVYVETSARLARNVDTVFMSAASKVVTTANCACFRPETKQNTALSGMSAAFKEWFRSDEESDEGEEAEEEEEEAAAEESEPGDRVDRCILGEPQQPEEGEESDSDGDPPWPPEGVEVTGVKNMYKQWARRKRDIKFDSELQGRKAKASRQIMANREAQRYSRKGRYETCHDQDQATEGAAASQADEDGMDGGADPEEPSSPGGLTKMKRAFGFG